MICIYIFLILTILFITFKCLKRKTIVKGGFIEDAEDGHTYIRPIDSNKNIHLNGNEIKLHSNNNQLQGQQLSSHLPYKDGHTYIRPGRTNHNINIDNANVIKLHSKHNYLHSWNNQLQGQQLSSHLPYKDGHTYIRPGRANHNINIDQANKINLGAKNLCLNGQCITAGDFVKLKGLLNQHQLDRRYTHTIQPNSANNRYALKKEGPHLVLRNIDAGHDSRWHMATHGSLT